ncbi:MAG: hypothetical protein ACWGNI_00970 [Desulfobacterales bacterium]
MISVDIQTVAGAVDTLPASTDPNYQTAVLSLMIRKTFEAMETAGLDITRPEISDFSPFKSSLSTYLQNAYDRETEIITDGVSSISANIPDILSIGAAYVSGGASEAIGCVLNIMIGKMLGGDSGAQGDHRTGDPQDLTSLINKLEEIREQISTILTEFNINTYNDPQGQSWSVGLVD